VAALLCNWWMALAAAMAIIYSAGIAEWDEGRDLERRFGSAWKGYRAETGNWLPRWRPFAGASPAILYMAATCGPCSELWRWLARADRLG